MRDIFPKRILAFSVTIAASGVGLVTIAGPFLAGYLVDHHGWQSVFWFLFAEQLVGLVAILFVVPESPVRHSARLDWRGAILLGGGLGLVLLGISQGATWHWSAPRTLGCIFGGLAVLAVWVVSSRRTPEPLMDLTLLRSRPVLTILTFGLLGQIALAGAATILPILVQTPRELGKTYGFGVSATQLTQFTVPAGAATVLVGFALGAVIRRTGAKAPVILGLIVQALGCLGLALLHDTKAQVIGAFLLLGISQALVFSSIPALVIGAVPERLQAVSAGMSGTTQTLGGAIGPAICFAILAANVGTLVQGQPIYTGHGLTVAYLATAAASVATLLVALAVPRLRVPGDAATTAETSRPTAAAAR
jgi:MFS family permease